MVADDDLRIGHAQPLVVVRRGELVEDIADDVQPGLFLAVGLDDAAGKKGDFYAIDRMLFSPAMVAVADGTLGNDLALTVKAAGERIDTATALQDRRLVWGDPGLLDQVASAYGSGNFINVLHEHLRGHEKVLTSRVNSKDDIYDSIKTFFGKGH